MSDLTNYYNFFHTWRSFEVNVPVDDSFIKEANQIIDDYVKEYDLKVFKDIITNHNDIKILHSAAIYEFETKPNEWKTNTQMLAPLLISVKPITFKNDPLTLLHIGRMYSKIGLRALEEGYKTGFCLCLNQTVLRAWTSMRKYVKMENGMYIRPIYLCIGRPLDDTKRHNWSYIHRRYQISHLRMETKHIKVIYE